MAETSHTLLDSVRTGQDNFAWQRWHAIYEPLILGWLKQRHLVPSDCDDVTQNVMIVVVRRLPEFEHNGRIGAFRHWLKTITINCLRDFWKSRANHPQAGEAMGVLDAWADPHSNLSMMWDHEHDQHVAKQLMKLLEPEFTPVTWEAFQQVVVQDRPVEEVASQLGITVNAVYIAKYRVVNRLRAVAEGLVDEPSFESK